MLKNGGCLHFSSTVKDVMVGGDVLMSTYKTRHPDDTDDPQDVGLSSDDEVTGMGEEIGISR